MAHCREKGTGLCSCGTKNETILFYQMIYFGPFVLNELQPVAVSNHMKGRFGFHTEMTGEKSGGMKMIKMGGGPWPKGPKNWMEVWPWPNSDLRMVMAKRPKNEWRVGHNQNSQNER
jgi:hypothetical protein